MNRRIFTLLSLVTLASAQAQTPSSGTPAAAPASWHGKVRELRYRPEGQNFVIKNGKLRFNRALYGTHTGFRLETGDLPEFALYMPGMGGNLRLGLVKGDNSKWLIDASSVTARYIPGSMAYEVQDPLLQGGTLLLTVIPTATGEGMLLKAEGRNLPAGLELFAAFGGATGKKFSRDGDIGADPESSFYLKPENCRDNIFQIDQNRFSLFYGSKNPLSEEARYEIQHLGQKDTLPGAAAALKQLTGLFPAGTRLKLGDASRQESPLQFFGATAAAAPALTARVPVGSGPLYFFIQNPAAAGAVKTTDLGALFQQAETARKSLAGRVVVETPDPYINTLGGALTLAADAVWEDPTFLHGAVAWRMRLNAWRGAYAADPLGWHDRARRHFSSYALSQVTSPPAGPVVADTALHLARHQEKMGTAMFSSGYICRNPNGDFRPHHYDMNLVFIDQLLNHFQYTGDTAYVREMWPVLQRHLDWEKRNFDTDGDGLYDAYCCIWASDALQYSGGGVTHSSSYNYRAFKAAAELARMIGQDGEPYRKEAAKILGALNGQLWMPEKGWYAEYKDLLSSKNLHPAAALWTIYHALDSKVPDPFQAYQSLRYVDHHIPRIPVRAKGLADTSLYLLSTTNWQPYDWSLNNVALAEGLHTALAYWQGGRPEQAYQLWKSFLMESMYMSSAPGNFQQLSYYDAIRGELYRDFADPIGMAARSLVEGLFGVFPDALNDTLHLRPGFPAAWDKASLKTPDLDLSFRRNGNRETYSLRYNKPLKAAFRLPARLDGVEAVLVNGKKVAWTLVPQAVETPVLQFTTAPATTFQVEIVWKGNKLIQPKVKSTYAAGEPLVVDMGPAVIQEVYDPQGALGQRKPGSQILNAVLRADEGAKTVFVKLSQGAVTWWQPISFRAVKSASIAAVADAAGIQVTVTNAASAPLNGKLLVNGRAIDRPVAVAAQSVSGKISIPAEYRVAGSNRIRLETAGGIKAEETVLHWDSRNPTSVKYEKVDLAGVFNDQVTSIFKNEYLSPRPVRPTLQLPTQGIGNWCYPLTMAEIDDAGLRARAGSKNEVVLEAGIPLATPGTAGEKNILYTSLWDNYPDSARVPLSGKAAHAYLLMAGSTNPMQTRLVNGAVTVVYKDGSSETLQLKNPENWWPIEQDFYTDGYAFTTGAPKPVRVYLKSGQDTRTFEKFSSIKGYSNRAIEGGAATVLDLPLDPKKELSHLEVKTLANDVVIGLMSITLVRSF
ncbi:DUF4450 domain-containing protein [Paraflavisolibacter sp. H34]|uniref:DUF4450 domain-containing protein n=1 Tax=Huijunlia imazamoxiresistens TaxID=3127457 RepID=UPI003017B3EF